ncbi:hypothetical protein BN946_scf184920.g39 [Trametes cinnabarina]|uniref:Protein kinase domain-containing protein n=1 Tax=Pycnoporus cinnabarinus TaxID=5643 RepID=A0A060SBN1_PYCCI|nr:hypothetical protein BN946_scf184920.g39 [Trametes cinnabarina]
MRFYAPSSSDQAQSKDGSRIDASDFEYIRTLNTGEAGEVIIARRADNEKIYTVKLIRKAGWNGSTLAARIRSEQKILRVLTECSVPFVVKLFWSFEDERAMYLVVVEGISNLHAHGMVHTNLRPESILIGMDGHLIISGFDDATFLYDDVEQTMNHRPKMSTNQIEYRAPELILGWEYDYAVDWWSFGLLLWWMFTGTHPFVQESDEDHLSILQSKLIHVKLSEDRLGMNEDAYQLITRCLQRNPALRIDGVAAKMHSYFSAINWDQVAEKQIEAPFARHHYPAIEDYLFVEDPLLGTLAADGARSQEDSFIFDHERIGASSVSLEPLELAGIRGHLQALRVDHGPSDQTIKPQDLVESPTIECVLGLSGFISKERSDSGNGEFGALPEGVSGAGASRIGNLRRHSSLHFDLPGLGSAMSLNCEGEGSACEPSRSSPVLLRHARSILGLSLGNTDDSFGSHSWTSKLRRRTRPESPSLSAPLPPLPKGLQQIGNGIGYTRRADVRRSVMTLASLTPRTCQSFFTGRLPRLGGKRKPKNDSAGDRNSVPDDTSVLDIAHEEDPMDEVMREIYGSDWAAGSPDAGPSVRVRERGGGGVGRVGLGWDETVSRYGFGPVDASFAGADSTLRLVSPSTPRLGEM